MNYKVLPLIQGSQEWLDARYDHITASDSPVLFDLSPYKTRLELFEEKVLRIEAPKSEGKETLFQIGHKAETVGREWVKKNLGLDIEPMVCVSTDTPDLMASLDGFNREKKIIAEFKYVGRESLANIKRGTLPSHHNCQVQAQLRVTGADKAIYFALNPDGDAAMLEVKPNQTMMGEIARASTEFMINVRAGEAPEPGERDYVFLDDPRFQILFSKKKEADQAKKDFEALKDELLETYKLPRIQAGGLKIVRVIKRQGLDYKKMISDLSVDENKWRKPGFITSYNVTFDKSAKAKKEVS